MLSVARRTVKPGQSFGGGNFSFFDYFSLAFGAIVGWGAFMMPGSVYLQTANPLYVILALVFGALSMFPIAYCYNACQSQFPGSVGEFSYIQHTFDVKRQRLNSYICCMFILLNNLAIVAVDIVALNILISYVFPDMESGLRQLLSSSIFMVILALVLNGIKVSCLCQKLLSAFMVLAAVGTFVASLSYSQFSLNNCIPSVDAMSKDIGGFFKILCLMPWAYVGFQTITQSFLKNESSTENKRHTKLMMAMAVSICVACLIYCSNVLVVASYNPEYVKFAKTYGGNAYIVAAKSIFGPFSNFIVMAISAAVITGIVGFLNSSARILCCMAENDYVPRFLGITKKKSTPTTALLASAAVGFLLSCIEQGKLNSLINMSAIGSTMGFLYTGVCTLKLPSTNALLKFSAMTSILFSACVMALCFIIVNRHNTNNSRINHGKQHKPPLY